MSSLDTKSELLIQQALEPLMAEKTTLIIAHRLTSITDADIIFVLYNGRFAEIGVHADLMSRGGIYRMLWDQMTREGDATFTGVV
jgi:ABC-type multidrug transport system fused ATPase/permease subunit